jgi:threonine aldolase
MSSLFPIELRSDTVTKPTQAMRKVMAEAEVGDDVFGEDPTVIKLQEKVADLLGKEAALYVPSGTMANQVCVAAQTQRGEEILLDENAHILNYEGAGPAVLSGVQTRTVAGHFGRITADQVQSTIRGFGDSHIAPTTLVCVENTHNRGGGTVYEPQALQAIRDVAHAANIKVHMDGARLWNAACHLKMKERDLAQYADSVSVCFSKGLGAPVGSAVCGTKEFIQRAHRCRKVLGGGMRQAGIIAAAALYAVEHHRERLAEDHAKAAELADLLQQDKNLTIESPVQSNILIVTIVKPTIDSAILIERCRRDGVLFFPFGSRKFRLVTHLDVPAEAMKPAAEIIIKNLKD